MTTSRITKASNGVSQTTIPTPDIWKQMSYTAPRGPCAHRPSVISPTCACLRFMIHPLKATSSFECDGCGHHASFHKMENRAEDEVVARWKAEEVEQQRARMANRHGDGEGRGAKKRRRGEGGGDSGVGAVGAAINGGIRGRLLVPAADEEWWNGPETDTADEDQVPELGLVSRPRRTTRGAR